MKQHKSFDIKKVSMLLIACYFFLAVAFYYLAGYQLHYRQSRGNLQMPPAEAGTIELVQGATVEQIFQLEIQRLQSISIQWGTYYRVNAGSITVELYRLSDNSLLMQQTLDASSIGEGAITTMSVQEPIESACLTPLLLRITSDSQTGSAVSPLMSTSAQTDGFGLYLNGTQVQGTLCFSADGEDYIWTGLHYWEFVAVVGSVIVLYLVHAYHKWKQGRSNRLINAFLAVQKYRFLIKQLVSRDFKAKYKRSILGVFWSFLNPLLTMIVQYAVFSSLFRFDIPHYPIYLLCGIIPFSFFSESCGMTLASIIGNANLITKVYVPKYIYPLTRTMSSLVNFLISLIPLFLVALFSGVFPTKAWLLLPFMIICLAVFSLGFGMLLATSMVFFRDTQFLWGVLSMIWMYMTPLFYPESILPTNLLFVLKCNPLYYFVTFFRSIIIQGISPEPIMYVQCAVFAGIMLLIGSLVFKKNQDRFVLYL